VADERESLGSEELQYPTRMSAPQRIVEITLITLLANDKKQPVAASGLDLCENAPP